MKAFVSVLLIIGLAVLLLGSAAPLWAQDSGLSAEVIFDKDSYAFDEPVGVTVQVRNVSGDVLRIAPEIFSSKIFYRHLWINDPAGRLLKPLPMDEPPPSAPPSVEQLVESPDAPPLAWVSTPAGTVRAAFCETLAADWESESWQDRADDLREHYPLELPGYYLVHLEIPASIFADASCDLNNPQWAGIIRTEPQSIYIEGSTELKVSPTNWSLEWREEGEVGDVVVQIYPSPGMTLGQYNLQGIKLNNVEATRVQVNPKKILAFFSAKECLESLGEDLEVGHWYNVFVSGWLTSGQPFGGGQNIRIVR